MSCLSAGVSPSSSSVRMYAYDKHKIGKCERVKRDAYEVYRFVMYIQDIDILFDPWRVSKLTSCSARWLGSDISSIYWNTISLNSFFASAAVISLAS